MGPDIRPGRLTTPAAWSLAAVVSLGAISDLRHAGSFKRVRGSRFAEFAARFHAPFCLMLAPAMAWVALGRT